MDNLEINNKPFSIIRTGIGILMLISAIIWAVLFFGSRKPIEIVTALIFLLTGLYNITNGFGLERSWIRLADNGISIKWIDRLRSREINDQQIENISLGRHTILIKVKGARPFKLKLGYMDLKQKTAIYEFLNTYAKDRRITIFRNPDPKK